MQTTRTTRRKAPQRAKAQAAKQGAVKRSTRASNRSNASNGKAASTPAKPRTTRKRATGTKKATPKRSTRTVTRRGGGAALKDFGNDWVVKVLKRAEIPSRVEAFKSGQTVSQNLAKQKAGGYRGRRKFLRAQKAAGRVSISKRS